MKISISSARLALLLAAACSGVTSAAERPTLNKDTCDPRPDILVHPIHDAHTEYRRAYNRPRFFPGWIAYKIAPSSQEAMVWCENWNAGAYDEHHSPPRFKRYYAPKPWEVLLTGPRPDTKVAQQPAQTIASEQPPALEPPHKVAEAEVPVNTLRTVSTASAVGIKIKN